MRSPLRRFVVLAVFAVVAFGPVAPAGASHGVVPDGVEIPPVWSAPEGIQPQAAGDMWGADALGLVAGWDLTRYSLSNDKFSVFLCSGVPGTKISGLTAASATAFLNDVVSAEFDWLSEGRYSVSFVSGGNVTGSDSSSCLSAAEAKTQPATVYGGIVIADVSTGYGFGGPGISCGFSPGCSRTTYPGNSRYIWMGGEAVASTPSWGQPVTSLISHELGHTLSWPHSFSGLSSWEYDNPIDLMSGNSALNGGSEPDSYSSLAFNRYAAGWIDPEDVVVHNSGTEEFVLHPAGSNGTEMVVLPSGEQGYFVVLDARVTSTYDPLPASWNGVSVHTIDQRNNPDCDLAYYYGVCYGLDRRTSQNPAKADTVDHVMKVGASRTISGVTVTVLAKEGDGYRIKLQGGVGGGEVIAGFSDIADSAFVDDIAWLADTGITKGCNPPVNDHFCPNQTVTRGQMAAFLVRALGLTDAGTASFSDAIGTTFETDIAKLATAGITKGCNPPVNDQFCPNQTVTRGQMAAFLVRALGLTDAGTASFSDAIGTTFETDIAKLATAGITKGCTATEFCPDAPVTRGQMAAFLHRAEPYLP